MGTEAGRGFAIEALITTVDGANLTMVEDLLAPSQYQQGVNIESRGGHANVRPPWRNAGILNTKFRDGAFQGVGVYRLNDTHRIIVTCGGEVIGIDVDGFGVTEYTDIVPSPDQAVPFPSFDGVVFVVQADKFFIVQDSINPGKIIDGESCRAPDHNNDPNQATDDTPVLRFELPIGSHMAYGHGRLFITVTQVFNPETNAFVAQGNRFFMASNIIQPYDPDRVLIFDNSVYPNSGGAFALPNELGFIKGMTFIRNSQSGTGLGALVVFARNGASGFNVAQPRAPTITDPGWAAGFFSQVLFTEAGTESFRSIVPVNNDIVFRGLDGLRTLGYSISDISGSSAGLTNTPISREMDPIFDLDDKDDFPFVSAAVADNRVFVTAAGRTDPILGHYFQSIVSMDVKVITTQGQIGRPIFDGIWTGLNFKQIFSAFRNGIVTTYAISVDPDGKNELWYLDRDGFQDGQRDLGAGEVDVSDAVRILSRLYTRAYSFERNASTLVKKLAYAEIWLSDIKGDLDVTIYFRPFGYALWNPMEQIDICAEFDNIDLTLQPQRRHKLKVVPADDDICDPITEQSVRFGSDFQFCIQMRGHARIDKVVFKAQKFEDTNEPACEFTAECKRLTPGPGGILLDDFEYSVYEAES